jgi:hypothetical protein
MSDYYNRETGWDALCRIMAERNREPIKIVMVKDNGRTAIKKEMEKLESEEVVE